MVLLRLREDFVVQEVLVCDLGVFDDLGEVGVRLVRSWDYHRQIVNIA